MRPIHVYLCTLVISSVRWAAWIQRKRWTRAQLANISRYWLSYQFIGWRSVPQRAYSHPSLLKTWRRNMYYRTEAPRAARSIPSSWRRTNTQFRCPLACYSNSIVSCLFCRKYSSLIQPRPVHVEYSSTLPELVFRFHRKHRQRWPAAQAVRPVKFPHFYPKRELDHLDERVIRPLDNTNMDILSSEDTIWVFGDRLRGHYELVRGARRSRIRSVSFAPASSGLQMVYRGALLQYFFGPRPQFDTLGRYMRSPCSGTFSIQRCLLSLA